VNILLLTQLFQPEPNHLKGLSFAKELINKGHNVEVLTGFPNYPGGRIYPGYKIRLYKREFVDDVPIIRVAMYPSHNTSGLQRIFCYISFALVASLLGLFLIKRPDVVHVYQGPATLVLPAIIIKVFYGAPYVLDIQDLWPESVIDSGMLRITPYVPFLSWWCNLSYRFSSKIVVLSEGYRTLLKDRGVPKNQIELVYNWCDEIQMLKSSASIEKYDEIDFSGNFNVIFAGTMGRLQALDSVIQAAALIQNDLPKVQFVFIGDGVDVDRLKGIAKSKHISNVCFIPRQPAAMIKSFLDVADVLLIHLKDNPLALIGIPQKTQAYLAVGKPILIAVRGESANLVKKSEAGIVCEPENPKSIADAIRQLVEAPSEKLANIGENGRRFYEKELSFKKGSHHLNDIFLKVIQ
jgi:glycosyltransferase involved in cell wall biosynthesis